MRPYSKRFQEALSPGQDECKVTGQGQEGSQSSGGPSDSRNRFIQLLENGNIELQLAKEFEKSKQSKRWSLRDLVCIPQSFRVLGYVLVAASDVVYLLMVTCFKPFLGNGCHQDANTNSGQQDLIPRNQLTDSNNNQAQNVNDDSFDNYDYYYDSIDDYDLPFVRTVDRIIYFIKLYTTNYPAFCYELRQIVRNKVNPDQAGQEFPLRSNVNLKECRPRVVESGVDFLKRRKVREKMSRVYNDSLKQWILQIALVSRFIVFIIQAMVFNCLHFLKHDNDGFKFTPEETYGKPLDRLVNSTLGGYVNWDAHYFLHISVYGYTAENFLAFFPLLPMILFLPSRIFYFAFGYMISLSSLVVILSFLLNTWLFVKTAGNVYEIAKFRSGISNQCLSSVGILFAFNPASIFFSGLYTETLYAYLTSMVLLSLLRKEKLDAVVFTGLSCLCRSNGILNIGFLVALDFEDELQKPAFGIFHFAVQTLAKIICSGLAFLSFQVYSIISICNDGSIYDSPEDVPLYCIESGSRPWSKLLNLKSTLPYSYIQKKYWNNVGFLQYFHWKQLPNFVLAFPVLYVLGSRSWDALKVLAFRMLYANKLMNIYASFTAVHGCFLTIFCFLFIHVQVSTRMIMAACPYLFTVIAATQEAEVEKFRNREIELPVFSLGITLWCIIYFIAGTIAFPLGLPWT